MSTVELPWAAWYQDTWHRLVFPEHWSVDVLSACDAPSCGQEAIAAALDSPIDSPPLAELAQGRRRACIVVDDLARPTRAAEVLPELLKRLHAGGLSAAAIRIVVATGSHGPVGAEAITWKVGEEVAAAYRVESHDCHGDLAGTGIAYGDRELRINRTFLEADLRLVVGSALPHAFAGFSGGAKLVIPGLVDIEATARSHKFVELGLRGGTRPGENRFRGEAEQLVGQLGLDFAVCVLPNARRETAAVFAGHFVRAHRRACERAAALYRTTLGPDYDCLVLNAYPKDVDLIQSEGALVALKSLRGPAVREGGVIVLATAAFAGIGRHGLFEPGGASYRKPQRKRIAAGRDLWLYVPSLSADQVHQLYCHEYPVFRRPAELCSALAARFVGPAKAAVLPCAAMQRLEECPASVAAIPA